MANSQLFTEKHAFFHFSSIRRNQLKEITDFSISTGQYGAVHLKRRHGRFQKYKNKRANENQLKTLNLLKCKKNVDKSANTIAIKEIQRAFNINK